MLKLLHKIFNIEHLIVTLLAIAFVAVVLLVAVNISFFNPFKRAIQNFSMVDVCYQVEQASQPADTSRLITIVDISDVTDRQKIALMVDSIRAAEPAVVAFDVIFDPTIGTDSVNMQLLESLSALPNSRYAFMMKEWDAEQHSYTVPYRSFFLFDEFELDGYVNTPESADGSTLRTFSVNRVFLGDTIESFPLKIASAYEPRLAGMRGDDRLIDFTPTHFPEVQWNEIGSHTDLLRDRIVIVGALHDLVDNHFTAIGRIAGVKIVAQSVQTLLENRHVRHASGFVSVLVALLIIYLTQLWQHGLVGFMKRRQGTFWIFARSSTTFTSLLTFVWVCLLTFFNFVVFRIYGLSFDLLLTLASVAMVGEARGFYSALVNVLATKRGIGIFRKSIYYTPA